MGEGMRLELTGVVAADTLKEEDATLVVHSDGSGTLYFAHGRYEKCDEEVTSDLIATTLDN